MSNDYLFGGNPLRTADALAEASVRHHGPAFLTRGGALGRAFSEMARGLDPEDAAAVAAKWGKGHAAELRLASEHSLDAAIRELPFLTRPNKIANARHADLEIVERRRVADTVQVGVGSVSYISAKEGPQLASGAGRRAGRCEGSPLPGSGSGVRSRFGQGEVQGHDIELALGRGCRR